MFEITGRKIGGIALGLGLALAGCATTNTKDEVQSTVTAAEATLNTFRNDPDMSWLRDNIKNAKAILISPKIYEAGFVVGGSTGKAVALSHGGARGWNGPAFYRISTASIGFQAGAQASEMVALIMSDKALNSLLSSSFKLGGDVSFAAGPVGSGVGKPIAADVVIYTKSKGLYGGLNLDGTAITTSDDDNKTYYGQVVTPVDILVKHSATSPGAASLVRTLSAAAP